MLRYYLILFDINNYEIDIKRHAFVRAEQRKVSSSMIEATIKGGKIKRIGKNYLRFRKRYKRFSVVCIGQVEGTRLKILTIMIECGKKNE
jgi:hypothetical protein